jgi:hypothetical protein
MRTPKGEKYCSTEAELHQYRLGLKMESCPHCGQTGFLICHGFLRGYAEVGQERVIRGRRFFCSNRHRRRGCGHTFSVLLADVLWGFMVRARTLWRYLQGVSGGLSRKAAWERAQAVFSLRSGYRLWRRLYEAQTHIRSRLIRQCPVPASSAVEPVDQLLAHLQRVFPLAACPLSAYQGHFQAPLLG